MILFRKIDKRETITMLTELDTALTVFLFVTFFSSPFMVENCHVNLCTSDLAQMGIYVDVEIVVEKGPF